MKAYGRTDKGIVRKENQDHFAQTYLAEDQVLACVVCDGMGGANAGNVASSLAAETFIKTLSDQPMTLLDDKVVGEVLKDAMMAANRVIFELAKGKPEYKGMGTTLVGAAIRDKIAHIINVGDSRAYHIHGDKLQQITRDHSVVEDMIARGDITREEAARHPNRNLITKVVGTEPKVGCDLFSFPLAEGDRILLCSDGLTNLVTEEEIQLEMKTYPDDLEKITEMLITLALAKGGGDNVTVLMVGA